MRPRLRTGVQVVFAGLAASSLLPACDGATPDEVDGTVAVVGDSLMWGALGSLNTEAADRGVELVVEAVPGRQVPESLDAIRFLGEGANVVVVALGTNDISSSIPREEYDRRVQAVVDAVPDGKPILLVNVVTQRVDQVDDVAAWNAALAKAASTDDDVRVLDWASVMDDHPEEFEQDGVHLTNDGYARRGAWTIDAAAEELPPAE